MYDSGDESYTFDMTVLPNTNQRLMSESPLSAAHGSSSYTGRGGDDLSLSELSLSARPALVEQEEEPQHDEDPDKAKRDRAKAREDKLREDLFMLKKLNTSFTLYNDALQAAETSTDKLAAQLQQTDMLLNLYVDQLARTEKNAQLILDERWHGAEADHAELEAINVVAEEKLRTEVEERRRAERERLEREREEEENRQREEERARLERERRDRAPPTRGTRGRGASSSASTAGAVRGVRGTRASMMGARGSTRAVPGISTASSRGGIPRPSSSTGPVTRGIRGSGIARRT